MSIVSKALVFATEHHQHQHHKGTKIPYMVHLLYVGKLEAENNCSDEVLASALLHDIVEDTEVTIAEVETIFGKQIAEVVRGATILDKMNLGYSFSRACWFKEKKAFYKVINLLVGILNKLFYRVLAIKVSCSSL